MNKDGKCIVVSDVHLGIPDSNRDKFMDFIDNLGTDVERLVLLGDIFDFWRRDPVGVLLENIDIVQKLLSLEPRINVHFVIGNHDFHLIKFPRSYFGITFNLNYDLSLEYGGTTYHFLHGYQLEHKRFGRSLDIYEAFADKLCMAGDDVGHAADAIWNVIGGGSSIVRERTNKIIQPPEDRDLGKLKDYAFDLVNPEGEGIYKGEFLVYGHTHEPFLDDDKRVANTGSWVKPSASYLEIDAGGIQLNHLF
jgi:UDP-2,3-diacylglucosamine pyrophosphatase LpxH